jgi:tRNA (guanine-N7-)-methyltransferase
LHAELGANVSAVAAGAGLARSTVRLYLQRAAAAGIDATTANSLSDDALKAALFPPPVAGVVLEIGFGGGESMIAQAQAQPRTGFLGVEPFVNGMAKALAGIARLGLKNIRLHFDDAGSLIAWLPEASLARIDLIHPDPWPKRRHWKRRFVQDEMVAHLARILRPGGEFRFVTDIADYAAWTLQRLLRSESFAWTAQDADDWRKPWPGFTETRYHSKAARDQRASCFLVFRRS